MQNAWYAYLKLQGMNLSKEEAERAVALKKFRNKIKRLKKAAESLKARPQDIDLFLAKEFSSFLKPNSLELKKEEGKKRKGDDVVYLTCGAHMGPTLSQSPRGTKPG